MSYPNNFIKYYDTLSLKLTSLRKEVLYILWRSDTPMKAYEILNELLNTKSNATPPNVYRTLDFFVSRGLIHKIESIQAYTICVEPIKHLATEILMVCNFCRKVIETSDMQIHKLFKNISQKNFFHITEGAVELKGTCASCMTT